MCFMLPRTALMLQLKWEVRRPHPFLIQIKPIIKLQQMQHRPKHRMYYPLFLKLPMKNKHPPLFPLNIIHFICNTAFMFVVSKPHQIHNPDDAIEVDVYTSFYGCFYSLFDFQLNYWLRQLTIRLCGVVKLWCV